MVTASDLGQVGFFAPLPEWARELLAARAVVREYDPGQFIARQHEKTTSLHILRSGEAQVLLRFEGVGDLVTETMSTADPIIGWSLFRPPYRYTASIRCVTVGTAIAIPREAFETVFELEPRLRGLTYRQAARVVADRLEATVSVLVGGGSAGMPETPPNAPSNVPEPPRRDVIGQADVRAFEEAPFFEHFSRTELSALLQDAHVEIHPTMSMIIGHGEPATALHMLLGGRARLILGHDADPGEAPVDFSSQTIAEPGRVMGWSALVSPYRYRAGAIAMTECRTLVFPHTALLTLADEHPDFGARLMRQTLHLLGSRLRETRMRLIARRYDDEVLAIRALIDQNAEELSISSPLHKLPVFLQNRVTVPDAITAMRLLEVHGDQLERTLATSCLDLMTNINTELKIFQRLQAIYQHVAGAAPDTEPAELRRACCEGFRDLFAQTHYMIEGAARLPDKPGHLFVMNHLTNDEANGFPNGFRLTMDTHFVSSMILYPKYRESPIRVIRTSGSDEYGHQMYYDRLGYIHVRGADVDPVDGVNRSKDRRSEFLRIGRERLARRLNVVICPEGNCTHTEDSPLPFKAGAFRLAAYTRPEPLIVPISVANFDKRLSRTTLAAVVHEPFLLSDHVPPDAPDQDLFAWVNEFQRTFAGYVTETIALAQRGSATRQAVAAGSQDPPHTAPGQRLTPGLSAPIAQA